LRILPAILNFFIVLFFSGNYFENLGLKRLSD